MKTHENLITTAIFSAVIALAPSAALADQHQAEQGAEQPGQGATDASAGAGSDAGGSKSAAEDQQRWQQLRERTVSAKELMHADVHNVANQVGNVRDLILTGDGSAVEFVLYEIPYPYALYGNDDGFVTFENIDVERGAGFDTKLVFADDAAPDAKERLALTRSEADHRMLSNILGETIVFAGDQTRDIEDVLIDRESGRLQGFVVNEDPDALFNVEPRMIPVDEVDIGAGGNVTTSAEFAALEAIE